MEINRSPSHMTKQVEAQLRRLLSRLDLREISRKERLILSKLDQNLADARIYTTDYELSETREEQAQNARQAKTWLEEAGKNLLTVSHLFSPIDFAHLSAQIEQISGSLK